MSPYTIDLNTARSNPPVMLASYFRAFSLELTLSVGCALFPGQLKLSAYIAARSLKVSSVAIEAVC